MNRIENPRMLLSALARLTSARAQALEGSLSRRYWNARLASLGPDGRIFRTVRIYAPACVSIGRDVSLNDFVHIWGAGGVTIEDFALVASHVAITSQSHDVTASSTGTLYRDTSVVAPVHIGRNAWICTGASILPGVTVGAGSIVAAGAVVSRDVPDHSLVMGIPARVVRHL